MAASAIFVSRPNSHPFQDRHVSLHEAAKVGRSVARARPATNNAIYDCKVLSRNHALLWYDDAKFFLQDTKSSNGTFVNNERLSKGGEESTPHELFSGDVLQFGVDVMENSRRVTHSCIIAAIQLFYPDGTEAKQSQSTPFLNSGALSNACLQSQQVYQLAQYLQESLHREQVMESKLVTLQGLVHDTQEASENSWQESKLVTLQGLVHDTQEASENSWQALIDEDRLLSRIEVLENQLQMYSKNHTEDTLRQELVALQEDKYNYETTAKESLRRVLQEKLEAVRKLSDLVRSLSTMEDECAHLRAACSTSQTDLADLAERHQQKGTEVCTLNDRIEEMERLHQDETQIMTRAQTDLELELDRMKKQEFALEAKVESYQAENDFSTEQMMNMKARLSSMNDVSTEQMMNMKASLSSLKEQLGDNSVIREFACTGVQVDLVNLLDLKLLQNAKFNEDEWHEGQRIDTGEKPRDFDERIDFYKGQLEDSQIQLHRSQDDITKLQDELQKLKSKDYSSRAESTLEINLSASRYEDDSSEAFDTHLGVLDSPPGNSSERDSRRETLMPDAIVCGRLHAELDRLKEQLHVSQQAAKQNRNEAEQLSIRVSELDGELALERTQSPASDRTQDARGLQASHAAELRKKETELEIVCSRLRQAERDAAKWQVEREGLSRAHTQPAGPDESHDHRPAARQRVSEANGEAIQQPDASSQGDVTVDSDDGDVTEDDFDELAFRSRIIAIVSMLPLLVLLITILLSFNPILSQLTATSWTT